MSPLVVAPALARRIGYLMLHAGDFFWGGILQVARISSLGVREHRLLFTSSALQPVNAP